ncbi:MAG TPA: low-specificity L-threonine aldolase [Armatimonadetes bacterium]|nr:low-specificity L-threonine aldolase [Armatimonadota bacterium]
MSETIDLRSDTVTKPTPEMYRAMAEAELGDDVLGDDPTVKRLEELAAEKVGKEAALFVPSGTMGNLVALMTHLRPSEEVIVEEQAHLYLYEANGLTAIAGAMPRPVRGVRGHLRPEHILSKLRPDNVHFGRPRLVCLENTANLAGGTCLSPEDTQAVCATAHAHGLAVHLDGARIFNAAVALGVDVRELTGPVDSVMFCLSKGLCAPVGSLLAGPADFLAEARRNRKRVGGGMRQAGILAACGIVALTRMVDRLAEDHENARLLAEGLAELPGIRVDLDTVETNMVWFHLDPARMDGEAFQQACAQRGLLLLHRQGGRCRAVTHHGVTRADIERALRIIQRLLWESSP